MLQAALLSFVLLTVVGLTTPRPIAFVLFLALVAVAFASIHQALVALLGGTGRLVALVYLVLQLASAGGTYAIATSPDFSRTLNPFMPLTYAVSGTRALIAGGPIDPVIHGVVAMLITTAVSLTVTTLAAHRSRMWSIKRLHPSLNV